MGVKHGRTQNERWTHASNAQPIMSSRLRCVAACLCPIRGVLALRHETGQGASLSPPPLHRSAFHDFFSPAEAPRQQTSTCHRMVPASSRYALDTWPHPRPSFLAFVHVVTRPPTSRLAVSFPSSSPRSLPASVVSTARDLATWSVAGCLGLGVAWKTLPWCSRDSSRSNQDDTLASIRLGCAQEHCR